MASFTSFANIYRLQLVRKVGTVIAQHYSVEHTPSIGVCVSELNKCWRVHVQLRMFV